MLWLQRWWFRLVLVLGTKYQQEIQVLFGAPLTPRSDQDDNGNTLKKRSLCFKTLTRLEHNYQYGCDGNNVRWKSWLWQLDSSAIRMMITRLRRREHLWSTHKEAKKTGKPVEEVIAEEKKRVTKAEKGQRKGTKGWETWDKELLPNVYKVHRAKPNP